MKNILIGGLVLVVMSFTSMTLAKSRAKSSKSSSKKSSSTTSKPKQDAPAKKETDASKDKQSKTHKNTKTHRCKLPNGKIDTSMSQQDCLKANGKWVKY